MTKKILIYAIIAAATAAATYFLLLAPGPDTRQGSSSVMDEHSSNRSESEAVPGSGTGANAELSDEELAELLQSEATAVYAVEPESETNPRPKFFQERFETEVQPVTGMPAMGQAQAGPALAVGGGDMGAMYEEGPGEAGIVDSGIGPGEGTFRTRTEGPTDVNHEDILDLGPGMSPEDALSLGVVDPGPGPGEGQQGPAGDGPGAADPRTPPPTTQDQKQ